MDGYPGESSNDDGRRNDWRAEQARRYNTPDEQDSGYVPGRSRQASNYEIRPRILSDSRSYDSREPAGPKTRAFDDQDTSAGFDPPRAQEARVPRSPYRSPNQGDTNASRPTNRALSFGKSSSGESDPLPRAQEPEPHRSAYRSPNESDMTTSRPENRAQSFGKSSSGEADPLLRTQEPEAYRSANRSLNQVDTTSSRPANRAQSFGKSNSADLDRQPGQLNEASPSRAAATSSSNYRTCMIEINISLGAGGRVSQLSATSNTGNVSAAATPVRTSTTIDNVHVIDVDLRLPKNTAYIKTDGNVRR